MLGIYADMLRTATRTNCLEVTEVLPDNAHKKRRLFWRKRTACLDPQKL